MNKARIWLAKKLVGKELFLPLSFSRNIKDASSSNSTGIIAGIIKRLGLRNGDISSKDFEEPEFDLNQIQAAYDSDSYVRQGIDKYVDQLFKEGWSLFGKDEGAVEYLKLRFSYMAIASGIPTEQLLIDIADDIVKFSNCILAKSRAKDQTSLPPGASITGIDGEMPVAAYFPLNVSTMKCKRDKFGTVLGWQQEVDGGDKPIKFKAQDIVHFPYKRAKGNAFGTPMLLPVLEDVDALRLAEESVMKLIYRNIYPFYHVAIGDDEMPGTPNEITQMENAINGMDIEGGLVTTNRVQVKAVASDKVIDASPYLKYLEDRVFSAMGESGIMFGRGDTANRSTGDNLAAEFNNRVKAYQKVIELTFNSEIIRELLLEGGYDPILNPEHKVEFRFKDNDLDLKIKQETHAVYLYEHNSISEDEMRTDIGRDFITDRSKMHQMVITKVNGEMQAALNPKTPTGAGGSKETDNKQKPKNQHGEKKSPKKTTNSKIYEGVYSDIIQNAVNDIKERPNCEEVIIENTKKTIKMLQLELHLEFEDSYIVRVEDDIKELKRRNRDCLIL